MTWRRNLLWIAAAGMLALGGAACAARLAAQPSSPPAAEAAGVMEIILKQPQRFESITVTLTGYFQGWRGPCTGGPPVSRNDWMIMDDSGCIYVNGPVPRGLDPARPKGEKISVTGVVRLKKGRPYVEADRNTGKPPGMMRGF